MNTPALKHGAQAFALNQRNPTQSVKINTFPEPGRLQPARLRAVQFTFRIRLRSLSENAFCFSSGATISEDISFSTLSTGLILASAILRVDDPLCSVYWHDSKPAVLAARTMDDSSSILSVTEGLPYRVSALEDQLERIRPYREGAGLYRKRILMEKRVR